MNTQWPGAFRAYGLSRDAVKKSLTTNLFIWVITLVVGGAMGVIFRKNVALNDLFAIIFAALVTGARVYTTVVGVRGQRVEVEDAFRVGLPFSLKLLVLDILVGLSIGLGLLLLIVPGLIVLARLSFAPYFMVDQNMGIMQSYKASWKASKGHAMKVWGIYGVTVLMCLPLLTIVGIGVTVYLSFMYSAANALLYQFIIEQEPAPVAS
ncbi:MAG TPA: YciC family protein [Candidatus Saccharimonadia bacterium]|nr:YciC family protein [Candidatus Saccharimonadia bacterium]